MKRCHTVLSCRMRVAQTVKTSLMCCSTIPHSSRSPETTGCRADCHSPLKCSFSGRRWCLFSARFTLIPHFLGTSVCLPFTRLPMSTSAGSHTELDNLISLPSPQTRSRLDGVQARCRACYVLISINFFRFQQLPCWVRCFSALD